MEFIKNIVASSFFIPAIICNYITKPFIFAATKSSLLAIYLHEKFQTKIGKLITQQKNIAYANIVKAEAIKILQQQQGQQQAAEANKLSAIINNSTEPEEKASNVFVIGKKKQEDK